MKTSADCDSDVLISTWDSAAGALSYTVEALGNRGDKYNCSSFTNSCAIPFVNCGEVLSIWITASHDECTTDRVLGEVAETGEMISGSHGIVWGGYDEEITPVQGFTRTGVHQDRGSPGQGFIIVLLGLCCSFCSPSFSAPQTRSVRGTGEE